MKIRVPVFIVILLLAVLTVPAFAAPPNYGVLKLGGYLPQASDVEDFDDAFYGELGLGHYFTNNWAIELGVGYTETEASVSDATGSTSVDLMIIPLTLGIRGSIPVGGFEPFATAGIGAYITEVDASGSGSEDDTAFGYYVGAGANFNVSPNIFLGVEGKYFWAEPSLGGVDVKIDGINLTANIGYRF
ncbi:MAG: hypothetical protein H6Q82_2386 [Deltaproteobacteria bacterium]|jgi:opacity protein-like surface antigen|nr:hypothetical protein [Deltaproteobacteria bacterium]